MSETDELILKEYVHDCDHTLGNLLNVELQRITEYSAYHQNDPKIKETYLTFLCKDDKHAEELIETAKSNINKKLDILRDFVESCE